MSVLQVLHIPDERLRKVAKPVEEVNAEIQRIVDDMFETMYAEEGIGLAATQVDIHQRIIVIDVSENRDEQLVLINPELLEKDGETGIEEGCLSIPEQRALVPRAEKVKIRALDRDGKSFELEADGLLAICIQHEMDHLVGKLFIDYLSPLKQQRIRQKVEKLRPPERPSLRTRINVSDSLRIIFAGTPDFAARHLDALLSSGHNVVGVFTQPDRPAGRGKKLMPSPVKVLAEEKGIPVFQPVSLRPQENQQLVADLHADVMVVVAYGLILPKAVLEMPRLGCINVHGSLLPRWRGAAPIQRSLWAGDAETGVTIMQMDVGLDTGDMLLKLSCPITAEDTSGSLYDKLADLGPQGLIETLKQLAAGTIKPVVQDESLVTHAEKLSKEEARIDWSLSAVQLERCIRAFNPWPMSWLEIDGQPVKVWQASVIAVNTQAEPGTILEATKQGIQVATGDGILNLISLQPAGKKAMSAQDLLNSRREWFVPGNRLA